MKEDILEQIVEDWLVCEPGWFVKHNIKYRPRKEHAEWVKNQDSVHSDIDILALSGIKSAKVKYSQLPVSLGKEGLTRGSICRYLRGMQFIMSDQANSNHAKVGSPLESSSQTSGWKHLLTWLNRRRANGH